MDSTTRTGTATEDAGAAGRAGTATLAPGRSAAARTVLWVALVACAAGNAATSWVEAPLAVHVTLRVATAVAAAVLVVLLRRRRR